MKKVLECSLIAILLIIVMSCDDQADSPAQIKKNIVTPKEIRVGDSENGVYYFNCVGDEFYRSLSAFLADSTKRIVCMTGGGVDKNGWDLGYFVIIKKIK